LRIDTKEIAARAAAEQWKLRRMIDYCYHKSCLRRFLLNYFGDRKHLGMCGTCSVCAPDESSYTGGQKQEGSLAAAGTLRVGRSSKLPEATKLDQFIIENAPAGDALRDDLKKRSRRIQDVSAAIDKDDSATPARALKEAEVLVVKKVLSCIARIEKEYGKNKFGKGTVAAVLRGSTSKLVRENNLNKLSTYGLLSDMNQEEITAFIKALIRAGCIAVQQGLYPTVGLTELGWEVMKGQAEVMLELPG
jgi:superfamily II DNA helicase RecQ